MGKEGRLLPSDLARSLADLAISNIIQGVPPKTTQAFVFNGAQAGVLGV